MNDRYLPVGANASPWPAPSSGVRGELRLDLLEDLVTGQNQDQQQVEADPTAQSASFQGLPTHIDTNQGSSPAEYCTTGKSSSTSPRR